MALRKYDVDPADVDADGLAAANDSSGASVTLDGALTSGGTFTSADGLAHRIEITDTATVDQSGATFTLTGTNSNGQAQTESILGPGSGATVTTTKYFLTVTSVAVASGAVSGTVNIGTADEIMTPAHPLDSQSAYASEVAVAGLAGTCQFDVDVTYDEIIRSGVGSANWVTSQSNKTADLVAALPPGATGVRLIFDSYTSGAELQFHVATPTKD